VSLTSPAGLTTSKAKLTRNDLTKNTKETAQFDIQVEASETGKKVLNAETKFVLCQESACKPVKEEIGEVATLTRGGRINLPANPGWRHPGRGP
jgi:hypothetical protein